MRGVAETNSVEPLEAGAPSPLFDPPEGAEPDERARDVSTPPHAGRFNLAHLLTLAAVAGLLGVMPFLVQLVAAHQDRTLPALPAAGALRWFADGEFGDLSQWTRDQSGEAVFNSGTGIVEPSRESAHGGQWGLKMSIENAAGETQAGRILRWHDNPAEGYYSVWFYFPEQVRPRVWWNIFQFKSGNQGSDATWVLNVGNRPDGAMYLYLWDAINQRTYSHQLSAANLPVGQWVELKAYYRRAQDRSGRITIWQDGVRLFDLNRVQTATSDELHWGLSNYTDDIDPPDVTIYADDAMIREVEQPVP
jgi:hypothetical protein